MTLILRFVSSEIFSQLFMHAK
uniref:Uncharacterized protein n=1 Tax=Arundo donax TaxID=35708 RepID=A0A0A8Y422_ARUDO